MRKSPAVIRQSIFLQAFDGMNSTIPVWFMRQAGRYLPQYQALKGKYRLQEMFTNPTLAAKVTCLPIDILKVDAAILFADILTLPSGMGFNIIFDNHAGPAVTNPIGLSSLNDIHPMEGLGHVASTIKLVNEILPLNIPLIGFAGSPFTVLTYLIEGKSSLNFSKTVKLAISDAKLFKHWMDLLTENTISYLNMQKEAGIKAYQLFDTWAGILSPKDYASWVLPSIQKIFKNVDLPSIYFLKNGAHLLPFMGEAGMDFLSVDHTVILGENPWLKKINKGIQGNLYNGLLYADKKTLAKEVDDLLRQARKYPRYIFNLSHGVLPDTDVEKLKFIVEQVHQCRKPSSL